MSESESEGEAEGERKEKKGCVIDFFGFCTVFSLGFYDKVNGMVQVNVTDTKLYSPLVEYSENIQEKFSEFSHDQEVLDKLSQLAALFRHVTAQHHSFVPAWGGGKDIVLL